MMKQMKQMKLVEIQFFDHSHDDFDDVGTVVRVKQYSTNVAIETQDKSFVVQLHGKGDECDVSIPSPSEQCWDSEEDQAWAVENFSKYDILRWLEAQGVENTFNWLDANADDHIN